jgi:hypothetical protein
LDILRGKDHNMFLRFFRVIILIGQDFRVGIGFTTMIDEPGHPTNLSGIDDIVFVQSVIEKEFQK